MRSIVAASKLLGVSSVYPDQTPGGRTATLQAWLLTQIQSVLDYVQNPDSWVFHITEPIGNFLLTQALLPLQSFLIGTPWFVTLGGLTLIAYLISGLRPAVTTFAMLVSIGVMGVWALSMDTLSQVLVATVLAVVFGVAFGVWAAESKTVSMALRPINDVLQTLPQLVYIIPFIYLMPVSIVPGIIAGVLYAFPVVVRLVERGVRDVAPEAVEAAGAFGATRRQVLIKVKIPLAGDAIMLGVNQGIVMVLAVVVIGGLVGSGGLGYEVAQGLVRGQFGQGVIASLAILALGIALDRVTQGTQARTEGRDRDELHDESHMHEPLKEGQMKDRLGSRRARFAGLGVVALVVALAVVRERGRGGSSLDRVRQRHAERERVGRVDVERLRRQVRAREEARLQGEGDRHHGGSAELPGDGRRQDRRGARGLAEPRLVPAVHEERLAREPGQRTGSPA